MQTGKRNGSGQIKSTEKIRIEIIVEGVDHGREWKCGLEFDHDNEEILYCRPMSSLRENSIADEPVILKNKRIAYLPSISGLISQEPELLPATVSYLIGDGRTAEVLRNLCYQVVFPEMQPDRETGTPLKNRTLLR